MALAVAALTLAARLVGFARSLVFSKTVGDTCLGDVYNAANTLPNVLFEIVAGGVLAGVVIPVVARHVGAERKAEVEATVSALLTWALLVLTLPALVAFVGAGAYARAFTKASCAGGAVTLAALLLMFVPQIWLYGLAVVTAGVLQAHGRFLAAATAPLISSVIVIAAYVGFLALAGPGAGKDLPALPGSAVAVLGIGTTLGVLGLALTTVLALGRLGLRLRPRLRFAPGDRGVLVRIASAGLAGLVVQQLSILVVSWVAQHTPDPGALTRYTWAAAIYLLPYAVLTAPLIQLVFPRLSAAAEDGPEPVVDILSRTAAPITLLGCLGAALLAAAAVPVARVFVLGPGSGDTIALARPIVAFAPAVIGFSLMGLATRTLLAQHQAREAGTTTVAAWAGVIVAVVLAWRLLPVTWIVTGLAAASSAGMTVGAVVGWALVSRRLRARPAGPPGGPIRGGVLRPLASGLPAALLGGGVVGWAAGPAASLGLVGATAVAFGAALAGMALFAGVVAVLDRRQLVDLVRVLRQAGVEVG